MNGSHTRKIRQIDLNSLLGKRLAAIRLEKHMKQREVAELMDVKRPLISKTENGHHSLDAMEIADYARALGIEPQELFDIIMEIAAEYDGRHKQ